MQYDAYQGLSGDGKAAHASRWLPLLPITLATAIAVIGWVVVPSGSHTPPPTANPGPSAQSTPAGGANSGQTSPNGTAAGQPHSTSNSPLPVGGRGGGGPGAHLLFGGSGGNNQPPPLPSSLTK